jgi:parallel beta-helix repeat protein
MHNHRYVVSGSLVINQQNDTAKNTSVPLSNAVINNPTIIVPNNYPNISSAVAHSKSGDVIYVRQGIYIESVTVDKPITLEGENKETTIVDGNNNGPSFLVQSDNVVITGFKVRNVENGPAPDSSRARLAGIHVLNSHKCNIYNNNVVGCGKGVWIYGGSANRVADNVFSSNNYGILVETSSENAITGNNASDGWNGILLESSQGNLLKNNYMNHNARNFGITGQASYNDIDTSNTVNDKRIYCLTEKSGLTADSTTYPDLGMLFLLKCKDVTVENLNVSNNYGSIQVVNSTKITITNNIVSQSTDGILLQFSNNCTVSYNNITQNTDVGIFFVGSKNVFATGNSFEQEQDHSIELLDCSDSRVTQNRLDADLFIENSSYVTISGNSASEEAIVSLTLESASNNVIQSNKFDKCNTAISLSYSSNNRIESNICLQSGPGISLSSQSNNNTIIGNTFVAYQGYYGLMMYESFENNVCENNFSSFTTGMQLDNLENNTIAKNVFTSGEHGAELFKVNNNVFDSNQFLGANNIWDQGDRSGINSPSINTWTNNGNIVFVNY